MNQIVLFDGECNLCNSSVQFIIKRDEKAVFRFASIQGDVAQNLMRRHGILDAVDSMVLIEDGHGYLKSTAALRICRHLKGPWKLISLLLFIPRALRDPLYDFVARRRYAWFGRRDTCMVPSSDVRDRFL